MKLCYWDRRAKGGLRTGSRTQDPIICSNCSGNASEINTLKNERKGREDITCHGVSSRMTGKCNIPQKPTPTICPAPPTLMVEDKKKKKADSSDDKDSDDDDDDEKEKEKAKEKAKEKSDKELSHFKKP